MSERRLSLWHFWLQFHHLTTRGKFLPLLQKIPTLRFPPSPPAPRASSAHELTYLCHPPACTLSFPVLGVEGIELLGVLGVVFACLKCPVRVPFGAKSASSVLCCLGRFNTFVHVTTKWGQENHEATQAIKSTLCTFLGVSGRQDQHPGRTCHQPVLAGQSTYSTLETNTGAPG